MREQRIRFFVRKTSSRRHSVMRKKEDSEVHRKKPVVSSVWIVFNWPLHLNGPPQNEKGQPDPWSDRPTSCETRIGRSQRPTVNGNNDECSLTVIPGEPRVVSTFSTGLTWSPFKRIRRLFTRREHSKNQQDAQESRIAWSQEIAVKRLANARFLIFQERHV